MNARLARSSAALLSLALLACETLPVNDRTSNAAAREPGVVAAASPRPSEPARPLPTLRRARGEVAVRLTRHGAARELEVLGASGGETHIQLVAGSALRVDGEPAVEALLSPRDSQTLLCIGGQSYAGTLRVRAAPNGRLEVTNLVDLEHYVAGVVAAEVGVWSAEPEELRAQAIAARSYAVAALDQRGRKSREPYLFDDVRDQVYAGALEHESKALRAKLARAVESTRGEVLLEGDSVVDARFHAACGGATANGGDVFPEAVHTSLRAVACEPCASAKDVAWSWTATREKLDALALRWSLGAHLTSLKPTKSDEHGRWLALEASGAGRSKAISFEELRRALGPRALQSSRITRTWPRPGDSLTGGLLFEGRGRGHGVGLCQEGARGYARRGWSAERMLEYYYAGARCLDFRE